MSATRRNKRFYNFKQDCSYHESLWDSSDGKHIVDFKVEDRGETLFSTPLGDDLCEEAPDILQSYCQNFVACAAYTFCGAIPIP